VVEFYTISLPINIIFPLSVVYEIMGACLFYIFMYVCKYKYMYMHECMYISILADPDLQEGGDTFLTKFLNLTPKIFHFLSLAKKVQYLSTKISDNLLFF